MKEQKKVIILNYTGRRGGGVLDAYEMGLALCRQGAIVIPIVSKGIENIDMWHNKRFKGVIEIDTYNNYFSYIANTLLFNFKQKKEIINGLNIIGYNIFDVKFIYSPMITLWTKKINNIFSNAKKFVTIHDPISHSGETLILRLINKITFPTADMYIVCSKKFVEFVQKKYGKTIYLPLGRHNLYRKVKNKKSIIKYESKKINFLFFGRIEDYKGLDVLIETYKEIECKYKDTTLNIIGNGDFDKYKDRFNELESGKLINRWIKDNEVESCFIGKNIVLVAPYKDATQSGVVLLSYDYGVPVIVTNVGALCEQVIDNKTGYIINKCNKVLLYNKMDNFIKDRKKIIFMKQNIKKYINTFDWNKSAKILINYLWEPLISP